LGEKSWGELSEKPKEKEGKTGAPRTKTTGGCRQGDERKNKVESGLRKNEINFPKQKKRGGVTRRGGSKRISKNQNPKGGTKGEKPQEKYHGDRKTENKPAKKKKCRGERKRGQGVGAEI